MKCPTGKVRFQTEISAQIALFNTTRKREHGPVECRYYYHRQCAGWHLTSQPPRENADR